MSGTEISVEQAVTHYTPEEHDQPACDADVAEDAPEVMFGTLNPQRVTCHDCLKIIEAAAGKEAG